MKLKKLVGGVATVICTMALMTVCAQAATTYKAGAVQAKAGDNVTVPIIAESDSADKVNGYVMTLTYDPTMVTPVVKGKDLTDADCYATVGDSMKNGIIVSDVVKTSDTEQTLAVSWAAADPVALNGSTELAQVEFKVNATATGKVPVQVAVAQLSKDGTSLDNNVTVAAGEIDLGEAGLLGDVNNDGIINGTDVTLTTQLVNNIYTAESLNALYAGATTRANVNKDKANDGSDLVNGTDVTLITQYVNGIIKSF